MLEVTKTSGPLILMKEGGERVPGFKVDERSEEVETIGGCERDDDVAERRTGFNKLSKVLPAVEGMGDLLVD